MFANGVTCRLRDYHMRPLPDGCRKRCAGRLKNLTGAG